MSTKNISIQQDQTTRNISVATPRGSVLRWDILIWWNLSMTPSSAQGRRKLRGWIRHLYAGHLHPQGVASCNRGRVDVNAESTPSTLIGRSDSGSGILGNWQRRARQIGRTRRDNIPGGRSGYKSANRGCASFDITHSPTRPKNPS